MVRLRRLAAAVLLAAGALLAPGGSAALRAQDADTPLDKALQQVQALIDGLRAQPGSDPKLLQKLEEIAGELRKEKDSRAGKAPGGGAPASPQGGGIDGGVMARTREAFLKGTELKEDEKTLAGEIITEFVADYNAAKSHDDEKSKSVIHDHTDKRIAHSFASRDANRMKDNLNDIIKFWEGRWGRGGR